MRASGLATTIGGLALAGAGLFWWVTSPTDLDPATLAGLDTAAPDAGHGRTVFLTAGCAACHAAPDAEGDAKLVLSGGRSFVTGFGTFYAPNISPDPAQGIGGWTLEEFARALKLGIGPGGRHLYPVFPYASYTHMTTEDIVDLKAYIDTLPRSPAVDHADEVSFPFAWRRLLGGWQMLYLRNDWAVEGLAPGSPEARGRYLAEGLAHCGECHTPRGPLGGLDRDRWLAGATLPGGEGKAPDLRPATLGWSAGEIADYLSTGFTPEFDSVGGAMAEVVANLSQLPPEDLADIAAYVKALPEQ